MSFTHQHFSALGLLLCLLILPATVMGQCTPVDFCGAQSIIVEASGNNNNPDYLTWFVLLDQANDLIVAANSDGDFSDDVSDGQSYQVHSLNFKTTESPTVIASLDPQDAVGLDLLSFNDGCYDPNFQNEFICFTYLNDCLCDGIDLVLNDPLPNSAHAEISITTDGTVQAGTSPIFKAGHYIQFLPGFQTQNTSDFSAIIEDCTGL